MLDTVADGGVFTCSVELLRGINSRLAHITATLRRVLVVLDRGRRLLGDPEQGMGLIGDILESDYSDIRSDVVQIGVEDAQFMLKRVAD
eukprot:325630-Rhodomonas_salina.1